jgi:hypothetical protein
MSHEWVFSNWLDDDSESIRTLGKMCKDLRISVVRFSIPGKGYAVVCSDVYAPAEVMRTALPDEIQWVAEEDGRFGYVPEKKKE